MSEIGIYTGGYQRLSDYARSLDRLLLDLQSGNAPSTEVLAPVLSFLEAMREEGSAAPLVRLLALQWGRGSKGASARLEGIIKDLRVGEPVADTIAELERLARFLDRERVSMRLRLRGT